MSEWTFGLAEPADAPAFSKWAAENPQIEQKDLLAGMKSNNPTVITFAVRKDGVAVAFAPVYAQMILAHLGFNPESDGKDKLRALQMLTDGVMAFVVQFGVYEIATLSKEEYGVAKWAAAHGFEKDDRQFFKLDINKLLAQEAGSVEAEKLCAPVAAK
jgi:hypothetical protein